MTKSKSGFTIVELLIVIVVIALLAAISIVAYSGIQQRANNAKTISAVSQVVKTISGYIAANGTYPLAGTYCVVTSNTCTAGGTSYASNTTLANSLNTISGLPPSVPDARPDYNGVIYQNSSSITFNEKIQPVRLFYSLRGEQQQCGLPNITSTGAASMETSTSGWTSSYGGYTVCVVSIPGP